MYNKEGKIKLETSAKYEGIGNTNIVFYDSDIGTADLIFYITRNQRPLEVSDENVDCFIVLIANDGTYIVDKANVIDPLNGKAQFTIPKEFLKHTGKVQAQLYIAVHGNEKIVTEVDFTFNIRNSLLSSVPAVDKLNYIRTFDDLKERIEQRVQYIEESLENGNDYVTQMDTTLSSGMKALNDRSAQVIGEINELADNYKTELNEIKDNNIAQLNTRASEIKTEVETLNEYDTTNWQKYKLTDVDGTYPLVDLNNDLNLLHNLEPGNHYVINTPISGSTSRAGFLSVVQRKSPVTKRLTFRPYNSNQLWVKRFFVDWFNWEKAARNFTDSGWLPLTIINGATPNLAYKGFGDNGFDCAYKIVTDDVIIRKCIRINVSNFTHNQLIAVLPIDFTKNTKVAQLHTSRSQNTVEAILRPNGELRIIINGDLNEWTIDDYGYGNISWIE
ncbi:phage baseplate upper protein [Staphylococcus saprophyticus]|uniref:phage baseplate upper protein n=1 Tax=Staphylococcus saprophyticus TaxID=29385 RepID=UPI0011AAC445|nr:BppU family phage baseplate upper protein [Staphylococcus saprophyticus]MDW3959209.1 BppU family phage baseplate upper protein [Staphylococcus saprophyticus]